MCVQRTLKRLDLSSKQVFYLEKLSHCNASIALYCHCNIEASWLEERKKNKKKGTFVVALWMWICIPLSSMILNQFSVPTMDASLLLEDFAFLAVYICTGGGKSSSWMACKPKPSGFVNRTKSKTTDVLCQNIWRHIDNIPTNHSSLSRRLWCNKPL